MSSPHPDDFEKLYEEISPALTAWSRVQLRGPLARLLEPHDLVQEVWLRGLEKYADFDADRGSFRAWLFGIAKFILLEAHRVMREPSAQAVAAGIGVTLLGNRSEQVTRMLDRLQRNEAHGRLLAALDAMETRERRITSLCGLEGLPHREVAELLGMKKDAVTKAWQRLRESLAREHPDWNHWAN